MCLEYATAVANFIKSRPLKYLIGGLYYQKKLFKSIVHFNEV